VSKPVRPVPWWGHVLLEYAVAAGLVDLGLRLSGSSEELLIACAALIVIPAVLTKTGTGLIRVISPRLHRALDFAVAFLLALSPFLAWAFHHAAGIVAVVVVEGVALVVVGVSSRSFVPVGAGSARAGSMASEEGRSKGGSFELLLGKGLRVSGRLWGRAGGANGVSRRLGRAVGRLTGHWTKGSR
jgi:hypothetical protein